MEAELLVVKGKESVSGQYVLAGQSSEYKVSKPQSAECGGDALRGHVQH